MCGEPAAHILPILLAARLELFSHAGRDIACRLASHEEQSPAMSIRFAAKKVVRLDRGVALQSCASKAGVPAQLWRAMLRRKGARMVNPPDRHASCNLRENLDRPDEKMVHRVILGTLQRLRYVCPMICVCLARMGDGCFGSICSWLAGYLALAWSFRETRSILSMKRHGQE